MINSKWVLITTYKVLEDPSANFRFMETFLNYYEKVWGIKKFILLIGFPEHFEKDASPFLSIENRIFQWEGSERKEYKKWFKEFDFPFFKNVRWFHNDNECCMRSVDLIYYDTNYSTHLDQWVAIKYYLFNLIDKYLDSSYDKILNIDNDEFLWMGKPFMKNKNSLKEVHFHYVEHVAQKKFNVNSDMKWCMQPWYYRSIFKKNEYSKDGLKHGTCKVFWFDRNNILNPWEHGGENRLSLVCNNISRFPDLPICKISENIGFHFGCIDQEHYIKCKAVNHVESQTEITSNKEENELEKLFNRYYLNTSDYPVFVDNFLKDYWVEGNG